MNIKLILLTLILGVCTSFATSAISLKASTIESEKKTKIYKVTFKDGQSLKGRIINQNETILYLRLGTGNTISFMQKDIISIEEARKANFNQKGQLSHDNANGSRYLWAPSAFMLQKGEAIFSQKQLFFSSIGYGLTDNINVQAGSIIPYWFLQETDENGSNFIFALKTGMELTENLNSSVGFQNFAFPGFASNLFLPFINFTVGTINKNFTLGYSSPIFNTQTEDFGNVNFFNASAFVQLNKRFGLITENHIIIPKGGSSFTIGSVGTRIMWEQLSTDIGFFFNPEFAVPLPWLSISYAW